MQGFNMGRYVPPEHEGLRSGNQLHSKLPPGRRRRAITSRKSKNNSSQIDNTNNSTEGNASTSDGFTQTVRFEMPFAVWCASCHPPPTLIPQGVRFNAEKRRVGQYYSTPIWAFRIRHTACGGQLEIRTDPKNTEYVVTEGGQRRDYGNSGVDAVAAGNGLAIWVEESYDDDDDDDGSGGVGLIPGEGRQVTAGLGRGPGRAPFVSEEESARRRADAFAALEGRNEDKAVARADASRMASLRAGQDRDWEDPYAANRRIRRTFRAERKIRKKDEAKTEELKGRYGLGIEIVGESEEDAKRASLVAFGSNQEHSGGDAGNRELFATPTNSIDIHRNRYGNLASLKEPPKLHPQHKIPSQNRKNTVLNTVPKSSSIRETSKAKPKHHSLRGKSSLSKLQARLQGNTRAILDPFTIDMSSDPSTTATLPDSGQIESVTNPRIIAGLKRKNDIAKVGDRVTASGVTSTRVVTAAAPRTSTSKAPGPTTETNTNGNLWERVDVTKNGLTLVDYDSDG